jgi:hypothetical protein
MDWSNKPYVGGGIMEGYVKDGVKETIEFYATWAPVRVEEARRNKPIKAQEIIT